MFLLCQNEGSICRSEERLALFTLSKVVGLHRESGVEVCKSTQLELLESVSQRSKLGVGLDPETQLQC
jgi:hypothetical protein